MKKLWILTEEMPKAEVVSTIIKKFSEEMGVPVALDHLRIVPIVKDGKFCFAYKVLGVQSPQIAETIIRMVSGSSSFVDFLVFYQESQPDYSSLPLFAIEETKTDDSESRNTGVYQRCSKFVYVNFFYPGIKKIMLYNLQVPQKEQPTQTNVFGMRMLKTVGVEVLGKKYEKELPPFSSLEELVELKNSMRKPPAGNVPIEIKIFPDRITVSGRLFKDGHLGHDPNIGALTIICQCIRKWEKTKKIVITNHGLNQDHLRFKNKFVQIASRLNIQLDGLDMPVTLGESEYWHYESSQEKIATILLHVCALAFTNAKVIYANHGGSERGYFIDPKKGPLAVEKYQDGKKALYKAGDKNAIIHLPDLVLYDSNRSCVIDVEGKKYDRRFDGIKDLENYDYFDDQLIKPSYSPKFIDRTVVIFGGSHPAVESKISFQLTSDGRVILSDNAPQIFREIITAAELSPLPSKLVTAENV